MEQSLSPIRHVEELTAPLIAVESPEFQRQTRDFLTAVTAAGKPAELIVGEGYNHFDLFETLANPYGILGRARLRQMGLGTLR
jgi:arylformamidase